jgi:hypothetical protein
MTTNPYNGFPPSYRDKQGNLQYKLFKSGVLLRPTSCEMCRLTTSQHATIHAHCEDYHDVTEFTGLCFCCHMALHRRFSELGKWYRWRDLVASGWQPARTKDYRVFMDLHFHLPQPGDDVDLTNWCFTLPDVEPDLYNNVGLF